ncbi:hypothetical protein BC827DRAFT_1272911 [Russula dissimulans]|nr:hypothetical protein BC827DRAFT_1272911 [Russula dissimulans]
MDITKEGLGEQFETMLDKYFTEYMVITMTLLTIFTEGNEPSGTCMTRKKSDTFSLVLASGMYTHPEHAADKWICLQVLPGDFVIIPPGIYHRFTLDKFNQIKALHLTKEDPMYTSYARGPETNTSASRVKYLDSLRNAKV